MKKIFLINSLSSIAELYKDYLILKGFSVEVAHNVGDFYKKLDDFDPDLVIFDTDMPVSESGKFVSLISSDDSLKKKPLLLLTGFINEEKIKGFENLESYEFLDKSSTKSQVLGMVESILQYTHPESNGFYRSRVLAEVPGLSS